MCREQKLYLGTNNPLYFGRDFHWRPPHQMDFGLPTFHTRELPKPTNPRKRSNPRLEVSRVQCNSGFLKLYVNFQKTLGCTFLPLKNSFEFLQILVILRYKKNNQEFKRIFKGQKCITKGFESNRLVIDENKNFLGIF